MITERLHRDEVQAETIEEERDEENRLCSRKIGRHTRSVVLLFRLKFLIAFSTYCSASFHEFAIVAVTIELKKDGTEESKYPASKSLFSLYPETKYLPTVRRGDSKLGFEK